MMLDNKMRVTSSPHIRRKHTTRSIMLDVIIALMPKVACTMMGAMQLRMQCFRIICAEFPPIALAASIKVFSFKTVTLRAR